MIPHFSVHATARLASGHALRVHAAARFRNFATAAAAPQKTKVWASADEAIHDIKSGDILLCGGV